MEVIFGFFFLSGLFFLVSKIYDGIRNNSLKNALANLELAKPEPIKELEERYFKVKRNIENQIKESEENLNENKELYNNLKKRVSHSILDWAERKQTMLERLEMMEAELKHTQSLHANLAEQHEKTEAIRTKYAIEMIEASAMLQQHGDQALKDKLEMVQEMTEKMMRD